MAVCIRCKTTFNYEERDGVCPKCCFYNRRPGSWQEDLSWTKNYNIEDNTYTAPTYENIDPEEEHGLFHLGDALHWGSHKEVSGSHKHTSDGRILKGAAAVDTKKKPNPVARQEKKNINIIVIVVALIWIYIVFSGLAALFF